MKSLPEPAVLLAGFALAHSVWSVSDLTGSDLLVPVAVVEARGERHLQRFGAATQADAIATGKLAMRNATSTSDAWAFARDGAIVEGGDRVDVLTVEFWGRGMNDPAVLLQKYRPAATQEGFRLLGDPVLVIDGSVQSSDLITAVLKVVAAGIQSHKQAAGRWDGWR